MMPGGAAPAAHAQPAASTAAGTAAPSAAAAAHARPHTAAPSRGPTAGAASSARPHSAPPAAAKPPAWASSLSTWWPPVGSPDSVAALTSRDITLAGPQELSQLQQLLSTVLGVKVTSPGEAGGVLTLRGSSGPEGSVVVRAADLSSLLGVWLRRPSLIASGTSQLRALANVYDNLPAPQAAGALAPVVAQLGALLGFSAFQLLANDEEDLYFAGGQHTSQLLRDLKTPWRKGAAGANVGFLAAIAGAVHDAASAASLTRVLRSVLDDFKSLKQLGQSALEMEPLALSVDVATASLPWQRCLASQLLSEAVSAGAARVKGAKALEAASILSPALQVSSLVEPVSVLGHRLSSRAAPTFTQLKGFPLNEGEINTTISLLGQLQSRLQDVVHGALKRVVTLKDGGLGREALLAWLAAAARLNWERTLAGEKGIAAQAVHEMSTGASDAWCVNITAVCLRFARPFVEGFWDTKAGKFADLFDKHLSPGYYATQPHRLPDLSHVNSLAGERGQSVLDAIQQLPASSRAAPPTGTSTPWLSGPAPGSPGTPSFIADCFFLTQTWLHVGLLPALFRYYRLTEFLHNGIAAQGPADPKAPSPLMAQLVLLSACERSALLETHLVEDTVQFCMLQISWLHHLLRQPHAPTTFTTIPDYVLMDPLTWLHFIISSGLAVHVASKDISALTSALAALLDARTCVRSPVLTDKAARLLLAMLAPQLSVSRRAEVAGDKFGTRGMLAASFQRPGEAALVAAVLNSPAAQSGALPAALMRAYVAADHVVGLDVDRDAFDKFTMRSCIDAILEELWRDERGRRSLLGLSAGSTPAAARGSSGTAQAAVHAGTFDDYVSCLFNSLIYLFKDSLDRLVDISKVEAAKRDAAGWAARPREEQAAQDSFLHSQSQTCRGFMRIAVQSLAWLNVLAAHPQTGAAFCRAPLSGRVAYSLLNFMELLSNTRAQQLQVGRPEQYGWDRLGLLTRVVGLANRLHASSEGPTFVAALAAEPDLELGMLRQVLDQLEAHHQVSEATQLMALINSLAARTAAPTPAARRPATADAAAPTASAPEVADGLMTPASPPPPAKRTRISQGDTDVTMEDATTAGDVDMTDAGSAGPAAGLPTLPGPELQGQELVAQYKSALGELQLGTFDASAARAYHSAFNTMAAESAAAPSAAMMKRVAREVRDMSSKTPLPCEPAASIFVRYDAEQMHKMRALITGPEGTPYAYGCFVFDLLFPPGYPTTPMLLHFETTGQGRARFNPNLYADGKVCLSLINTWHASHESEKWNAERTTTFQVLVSIQAMILVEDPYYNEPAHEVARGTDTGQSSAAMYNAQLTLNTLRWSILDKLKQPPPGLEEVVRAHFRLLRHKVWDQAQRWLQAAKATGDDTLGARMQAAVQELHQLLLAL